MSGAHPPRQFPPPPPPQPSSAPPTPASGPATSTSPPPVHIPSSPHPPIATFNPNATSPLPPSYSQHTHVIGSLTAPLTVFHHSAHTPSSNQPEGLPFIDDDEDDPGQRQELSPSPQAQPFIATYNASAMENSYFGGDKSARSANGSIASGSGDADSEGSVVIHDRAMTSSFSNGHDFSPNQQPAVAMMGDDELSPVGKVRSGAMTAPNGSSGVFTFPSKPNHPPPALPPGYVHPHPGSMTAPASEVRARHGQGPPPVPASALSPVYGHSTSQTPKSSIGVPVYGNSPRSVNSTSSNGAATPGDDHRPGFNRAATTASQVGHPMFPPSGAPPRKLSGPSVSKEEVATIEYYLRQALAARDLAALTDLVKRATDKHLTSDLVAQARTMLNERAAEQQENEIGTLKHFMKLALTSRRADPIRDVLRKVEPVSAGITTSAQRKMHLDFFSLIDECNTTLLEIEKEDAQTVVAYLRQGIQVRSREVLQHALSKAASIKQVPLDEAILAQAKQVLGELDNTVMLRNYLTLAMKNAGLAGLDETIAQAVKGGLTDKDSPELVEAKKLAEELRKDKKLTKEERAEKSAKEKAEKEKAKLKEKEDKEKEKQEKATAASSGTNAASKDRKGWFGSGSKEKQSAKEVKKAPLFGGPLDAAIKRNAPSTVPKVVEQCIAMLRRRAMKEPGLFRVAGNKDLIDALRIQYEEDFANEDSKPAASPPLNEIHDVSGLIKLYFRQLPEPLLPFEYYDRFVKVGMNKGPDRAAQLKELVKALPKEILPVASELFKFLRDVSLHSATNKMTPDNLAIVWAPNLLRPKVETATSMMTEMPSTISVVATLVGEYATIFDEPTNGAASASSSSTTK